MRLSELGFQDLYHQYFIVEGDDLTERFSGQVRIREEDCFLLCSCYIEKSSGILMFNAMAVGSSWNRCRKGFSRSGMLGVFLPDEIMDCEARRIEPDFDMVAKNRSWQEAAEMGTDEDVMITRREPRLDPMRDISYPDVLTTGVLHTNGIYEVQMRASRFNGPFLEGRLWQEPVQRIGIHKDDLLRALTSLVKRGADVIILGCTELPLLLAQNKAFPVAGRTVAVLDPTDILARKCVSLGRQAAGE